MNTSPTRTRLATAGLVAGAAAFAGADLLRRVVEPATTDTASLTTAAHDHYGAWTAAGLLAALASFVLLPGVLAAGRAARERGATLTVLGGALTCVGVLAALLHTAGYYGLYGLYAKSGADAGAIHAIDTAPSPLFNIGIALFMIGMMLGPILLTIGLRRAALVPVWTPVAAVVFAVSGAVSGVPAGVVGLIAAVATFGGIGVYALRRSAAGAAGAAGTAGVSVTAATAAVR